MHDGEILLQATLQVLFLPLFNFLHRHQHDNMSQQVKQLRTNKHFYLELHPSLPMCLNWQVVNTVSIHIGAEHNFSRFVQILQSKLTFIVHQTRVDTNVTCLLLNDEYSCLAERVEDDELRHLCLLLRFIFLIYLRMLSYLKNKLCRNEDMKIVVGGTNCEMVQFEDPFIVHCYNRLKACEE